MQQSHIFLMLLTGLGTPADLDSGMMNTWHFSMFSSVFNRLKRSSRRTLNPEEAKLFFIPYDMGLDGTLLFIDVVGHT